MRKSLPIACLLMAALAGCVERKIYIRTEPEGATVSVNHGEPLSDTTPLERRFQDHGVYAVAIEKEGYVPLETTADVKAPWWQWPPFDLISDLLWPGTLEDHHYYRYELEEEPPPMTLEEVKALHADIRERAEEYRELAHREEEEE